MTQYHVLEDFNL